MAKTPRAKRVHAKLYMAGQRVPLKNYSVGAGINNHLQAQIEIPPIPLVTRIQPRTVVELVTKESEEDDYELLFEGEYVAYTLREETGSKGFVLHCVGLTNYWETTFQYFLNKLTPGSMGEQETAAFVSGGPLGTPKTITSVVVDLPTEIFSDYVVQALTTNGGNVQHAILNAISLMANVTTQNGDVTNPRINSQIERAFVNLRLGERVVVLPDEAIKSLIDLKTASALINKMTGSLSNFSTLTGVITAFLSFVYYDWVPLAAPPYTTRNFVEDTGQDALDNYRPAAIGGGKKTALRDTISSIVDSVAFPIDAETTAAVGTGRVLDSNNVQRDVIFKPKTYFLPPPTCNLVFPGQYDSFSSTRNFLQEPTRLRMRINPLPGQNQKENRFNTLSYYAPPEIKEALTRERDTSHGEIRAGSSAPGSEPAANPAIKEGPSVKRYETLIKQLEGDIDENVTGIIPSFEELGFAEYAALTPRTAADATGDDQVRADSSMQATLQKDSDKPAAELKDDLHKYLASVAQYKLDLKRSAQRTISGISGPYNPKLVVGFSGLVFSKTAIFAGEITNLNHGGDSQGQASTVFTLGFARELSVLPAVSIGSSVELSLLETALIELSKDDPADVSEARLDSHFLDAADAQGLVFSPERAGLLIHGFDPIDRFPNPPEWINELYRPDVVAESVYKPLFGSNVESSVSAAGVDLTHPNQVIAANILFLRYLRSTDRLAHVATLTDRNIATAKQVLTDFLGLPGTLSEKIPERGTGPHREELTKGLALGRQVASQKAVADDPITDPYSPFLESQVATVKDYVNFISKSKGFRG